jgi:hypothetical protein
MKEMNEQGKKCVSIIIKSETKKKKKKKKKT